MSLLCIGFVAWSPAQPDLRGTGAADQCLMLVLPLTFVAALLALALLLRVWSPARAEAIDLADLRAGGETLRAIEVDYARGYGVGEPVAFDDLRLSRVIALA